MAAAQTSKEAAAESADIASGSAIIATEQADRAQGIADNLKGLDGITGIATTEEAIAGESDTKAMTPLKTKEAIEALVPMQRLIDLIYPIGSIYMSVNSTSPADLFGGTWEAMPAGRVLLAQGESEWGTTYTAGSTGGEATHQLSVGELPKVTPTGTISTSTISGHIRSGAAANDRQPFADGCFSVDGNWMDYAKIGGAVWAGKGIYFNYSHAHNVTINAFGSDQAHNNLQPYIAVFVWRRIL